MTASTAPVVVMDEEEDENVTHPESMPTRPTREQVVAAIQAETKCSRVEAFNMIQWVEGFVKRSRQGGYVTQYPTARQMAGRNYQVFDAIMPHGQASTPGSAHQLLERLILDSTRNETSLWHDRRDEPGSPAYCTVQVALGVIKTETPAPAQQHTASSR